MSLTRVTENKFLLEGTFLDNVNWLRNHTDYASCRISDVGSEMITVGFADCWWDAVHVITKHVLHYQSCVTIDARLEQVSYNPETDHHHIKGRQCDLVIITQFEH